MKSRIETRGPVGMDLGLADAAHQTDAVRDSLRFPKLWLRRPASFGAVLPSGKSLARTMALQIDSRAPGVVVELGGGTGSITAAILECGTSLDDLLVIASTGYCRMCPPPVYGTTGVVPPGKAREIPAASTASIRRE